MRARPAILPTELEPVRPDQSRQAARVSLTSHSLTLLEATLMDCLPFYKQNAPVTHLKSTPPSPLISVVSKGLITPSETTLTESSPANPLEATLTKNRGEGAAILNHPFSHAPSSAPSVPPWPAPIYGVPKERESCPRQSVPNRTDDYPLPRVYSRRAILPSPRSGDRSFLALWRSL